MNKAMTNLLKIVFAFDEVLKILRLGNQHKEKATRAVFLHFDVQTCHIRLHCVEYGEN